MEETVYLVDDEVEGEEVRTVSKKSEMLFVRGEALCRPKPDLLLTTLDRRQRRVDFPVLPIMILGARSKQNRIIAQGEGTPESPAEDVNILPFLQRGCACGIKGEHL